VLRSGGGGRQEEAALRSPLQLGASGPSDCNRIQPELPTQLANALLQLGIKERPREQGPACFHCRGTKEHFPLEFNPKCLQDKARARDFTADSNADEVEDIMQHITDLRHLLPQRSPLEAMWAGGMDHWAGGSNQTSNCWPAGSKEGVPGGTIPQS